MKNRRLIEIVMVVVSTSLLTCKFTQVKSDDAPGPGPGGNRSEGNILAGTFQGTFSIGKDRVIAAKGSTALVVANLGSQGQHPWMRSFDGLAPGRAVASTQVPGRGTVVAGVFIGHLSFYLKGQEPLDSRGHDGLFLATITSTGRVTSATTIARAMHFASPTVSLRGDQLVLDVPYTGTGDVADKALPLGNGQTVLHLVASREGTVTAWEVLGLGGNGGPTTGPVVPRRMMLEIAAGACNVCQPDLPKDACGAVRNLVCPNDGWCCDTGWDRQCMDEAFQGDPNAQNLCKCPHAAASADVFMYRMCLDAKASHNCVLPLTGIDPYCGENEWDSACVNRAVPMSACTGS